MIWTLVNNLNIAIPVQSSAKAEEIAPERTNLPVAAGGQKETAVAGSTSFCQIQWVARQNSPCLSRRCLELTAAGL